MSLFWGANGNMSQGSLSLNNNQYISQPARPTAGIPSLRFKAPVPSSMQYTGTLGTPEYCGFTNLKPNVLVGGEFHGGTGLMRRQTDCPNNYQRGGNAMTMQQNQQQGGSGAVGGAKYVPTNLGFKNVNLSKVIKQLGPPSLTDPTHGGIALWSRGTLRKKGYRDLVRVEVIDEQVPVTVPVPHVSNLYVWVKIPMTNDQMDKILDLSPNFLYDQKKHLLIVRSKCLNTAIALAALVKLYAYGKLSIYQINNYQLMKKYFMAAKKSNHAASRFRRVLKTQMRRE